MPTLRRLHRARRPRPLHIGRRARLAAGPAERPRPSPGADADEGARAGARRSRCCSRSGLKDEAFLEPIASLRARPRRRCRVRQASARSAAADSAARHDQRARVAAAALARRRAGSPRGHRRRPRDRRHDHARRERARRRSRCSRRHARRSGPTKRASTSSAISPRWALALLVEVLDDMAEGRAVETPQDESLVTYAAKITKAEGAVDWSLPAERIHNLVRGLAAVAARVRPDRRRARALHRTALTPAVSPDRPGTIVRAEADRFEIAAGDGHVLRISTIQPEGRRAMSAREFLAGRHVAPGDEDRARMIAPARVAAYRGAARGLDRQRRPAPRACPRAHAPAGRARSRAGRRDRRPARCAGRGRSITSSRRSAAARSRGSIPKCSTSSAARSSSCSISIACRRRPS